LNRYSGLIGTGWDGRLRIRPEPKIKIKSTITIKMGAESEKREIGKAENRGTAPEPKIKIKSTITIKILMGTGKGHTSRGHLTRHTVTTSVNTGDFVHLTRNICRHMP
jgi:hypothetical protein